MNWGTKLMIGMGLFMAFIIALGTLMIRSKSDALVDSNYYERGIRYDEDYQKKEQVKKDHAEPGLAISNTIVALSFKKPATGTVRMMRPADKRLDRTEPFKTNAQQQLEIPLQHFTKGRWKIELEWQSEGKSYLYEKEINL